MADPSGSFTIGGTSPDFATIQLWDDNASPTLTGLYEGKMRAGEYNQTATIAGSTTTSSNYKLLTYDTAAFHTGSLFAGVQMHGASENSGDSHILIASEDYLRIVGLNFNRWHGVSAEAIRIADGGSTQRVWVENCLFWGAENINADAIHLERTNASSVLYSSNNFYGWIGRSAILAQGSGEVGSVYIYNSTGIHLCNGVQGPSTDDPTNWHNYPGFGDDRNGGTTSGITWYVKNTISHTFPDPQGQSGRCFYKTAASSWGAGSGYNASTDDSASDINGTNYQDSITLSEQFTNIGGNGIVGDNTGNDWASNLEDARINAGAATTNYGSATTTYVDNSPINNTLFRFDLSNVSNSARLLGACLYLKMDSEATADPQSISWYRVLEAWTEAGVTYNKYDGTNDWATAGATGTGDIEANCADGGTSVKRSTTFVQNGSGAVVANEWFLLTFGGRTVEWIQDAIDGAAPSNDVNTLDVITRWQGVTGTTTWDSADAADGSQPELEIWYDTAADPLNLMPTGSGVLDGNGTDLSGDTYAISTDILGVTRSEWDIGAWAMSTLFPSVYIGSEWKTLTAMSVSDGTTFKTATDAWVSDGADFQKIL